MHTQPATISEWSSHLFRTWGLTLTQLGHRVPLNVVATTQSGFVGVFTGAGTTLRLALYPASAMVAVTLRPDCDCGEPHSDKARTRTQLDRSVAPVWQGSVDGAARYGWRGVDAALVPVPQAAAILDELLHRAVREVPHTLPSPGARLRRRPAHTRRPVSSAA